MFLYSWYPLFFSVWDVFEYLLDIVLHLLCIIAVLASITVPTCGSSRCSKFHSFWSESWIFLSRCLSFTVVSYSIFVVVVFVSSADCAFILCITYSFIFISASVSFNCSSITTVFVPHYAISVSKCFYTFFWKASVSCRSSPNFPDFLCLSEVVFRYIVKSGFTRSASCSSYSFNDKPLAREYYVPDCQYLS